MFIYKTDKIPFSTFDYTLLSVFLLLSACNELSYLLWVWIYVLCLLHECMFMLTVCVLPVFFLSFFTAFLISSASIYFVLYLHANTLKLSWIIYVLKNETSIKLARGFALRSGYCMAWIRFGWCFSEWIPRKIYKKQSNFLRSNHSKNSYHWHKKLYHSAKGDATRKSKH